MAANYVANNVITEAGIKLIYEMSADPDCTTNDIMKRMPKAPRGSVTAHLATARRIAKKVLGTTAR